MNQVFLIIKKQLEQLELKNNKEESESESESSEEESDSDFNQEEYDELKPIEDEIRKLWTIGPVPEKWRQINTLSNTQEKWNSMSRYSRKSARETHDPEYLIKRDEQTKILRNKQELIKEKYRKIEENKEKN